jgi:hypothetical protein
MGRVSGDELDAGKAIDSSSRLRWVAVTNSNFDTSATVYQYGIDNGILPIAYVSYHPVLNGHSCRNVRVRQQAGEPRHWQIEAEYSTAPIDQDEQEENPLNRPVKRKWTTNKYRQAIDKDINGQAILNSAGDPYDPPLEVDRSHWTCSFVANVADVPAYILDYEDAINNASIMIGGIPAAQYTAKIDEIDISELKIEGDYEYYEFGFTLEFRREKWNPVKVLDQGMRYKSGSDRKQIMDNSTPARPVSSAKLLDGAGAVLANPSVSTAVYNSHTCYYAKPFNVLPGVT